jgi:GT2 family glycosyltransferase
MKKITAILNCFRRPHTLKQQYEAIKKQTIDVNEIMIWKNHPEDNTLFDFSEINDSVISVNNANYGVWARFAFALNSNSEYICIFDDDTIPGINWFKNCIENIEKQNGLYGSIGVIFNDLNYSSYIRHGWANPNDEVKQVDIVGHAWFFHRDLLSAFWRESTIPISHLCGEDMHFSYAIQKYLGLNTYVPPHPESDNTLWGSCKDLGYKLGVDKNAISVNYHSKIFADSLKHYHSKGFKLLNL